MKRMTALLLCLVLLAGVYSVAAAPGGVDDPLISLSYLYDTLVPYFRQLFSRETQKSLDAVEERVEQRLEQLEFPAFRDWDYAPGFTPLELEDGGSVTLDEFGCFLLLEGTVKLRITAGEVIDISTGEVCTDGQLLPAMHRYFAAEESGAVLTVYSPYAEGMVDGFYRHSASGTIPVRERFLDVDSSHWAAEYIWKLAEASVVNGVEPHHFAPGATVTRGTFVTILGRLCGVSAEDWSEQVFPDVKPEDWFGPYVCWAAAGGIVTGYDDGSFRPNAPINREQMALMMQRYAAYLDVEPETVNAEGEAYRDLEEVSDWALEAVLLARDTGLMTGREGNLFEPAGTANRAEICTVAWRFAEKTGILGEGDTNGEK